MNDQRMQRIEDGMSDMREDFGELKGILKEGFSSFKELMEKHSELLAAHEKKHVVSDEFQKRTDLLLLGPDQKTGLKKDCGDFRFIMRAIAVGAGGLAGLGTVALFIVQFGSALGLLPK